MNRVDDWVPFSWHCVSCGETVTGYKNSRGDIKVECKRCHIALVRTLKNTNQDMLYSPVEQIPIGIPVLTTDGKPAIRIKYTTKRNQHKVEDVPLEYILTKTISATADRNSQMV